MQSQNAWSICVGMACERMEVRLQEWSLLAMGEGHIVLQNNNRDNQLHWKVLTICIHVMDSVPKEFQKLYFEIIGNIPNIKQYLIERELVELNQKDRQTLQQYLRYKLKISNQIAENFMVHLSDNLNRMKEGWHYSLQFKPKSVLADKYSTIFIEQISQKLGIKSQLIVKTLNNRPINEKNRWFKKNVLKTAKKNINPLQIFGVGTQMNPNIIDNLNKIETFEAEILLTSDKRKNMNDFLMKALRSSKILQSIVGIQFLFPGPSDFPHLEFAQLWEKQQNKTDILSQAKKAIENHLRSCINVESEVLQLLQSSVIQQPKIYQNDSEVLISMLKFLMSWSWRDVSLFVRFKLNLETCTIDDIDFKIIDYQLKESSKLKETIEKDQKFLINYLKYLNLL